MFHYPPAKQRTPSQYNVLCIKWGDKYPAEYVYKLQNACHRHLPGHRFICITDDPIEGVQCDPLLCDLPGWWQKVGLFQRGIYPGRNLYFDLDVVITENLAVLMASLFTDPTKLWAIDDFSYSLRTPKLNISPDTRRQLGGIGTINSSVMGWVNDPHTTVHRIWEQFDPAVMDVLHGDQNWITQAMWPDNIAFWPDGYIRSYKYHNRQKAAVSVFHGDPKPHQVIDQWVIDHWI